jgi:hypothetical protein
MTVRPGQVTAAGRAQAAEPRQSSPPSSLRVGEGSARGCAPALAGVDRRCACSGIVQRELTTTGGGILVRGLRTCEAHPEVATPLHLFHWPDLAHLAMARPADSLGITCLELASSTAASAIQLLAQRRRSWHPAVMPQPLDQPPQGRRCARYFCRSSSPALRDSCCRGSSLRHERHYCRPPGHGRVQLERQLRSPALRDHGRAPMPQSLPGETIANGFLHRLLPGTLTRTRSVAPPRIWARVTATASIRSRSSRADGSMPASPGESPLRIPLPVGLHSEGLGSGIRHCGNPRRRGFTATRSVGQRLTGSSANCTAESRPPGGG